MPEFGPLGCILEEEYTLASDEAIAQATGESPLWRDSAVQWKGSWQRLKEKGVTLVFLLDAYQKAFGKFEPYWQKFGTCVGRGANTAAKCSLASAVLRGVNIGRTPDLSYELIYIMSRLLPGKGRLRGDGSVGAWAAEVQSLYGMAERGVYGGFDFSQDNERLAVSMAEPNDRVPAALLDACKGHTFSTKRLEGNNAIADSIASNLGVYRCWNTLFGNRDANGMARPASTGAHCQAVVGVFVQPNGRTGFIEAQSWGPNMPKGPLTLKHAGGVLQLPPGCYGVDEDDYRQAQASSRWWEAYACQLRLGSEWR